MAFTPFVETDQPTMAEFNEKFQECIQEAADKGTEVFTGSYVGTGTYGVSNPNTLTFPFKPKLWGVYALSGLSYESMNSSAIGRGYADTMIIPWIEGTAKTTAGQGNITMSGNSVSWYAVSLDTQCNSSSTVYYYFAIGKGASE